MIFRISKTSTYAAQIAQNSDGFFVHSIYRNTVNLSKNGQLLALQTAYSPVSPISLITDLNTQDFEVLPIKNGDEICLDFSRASILSLSPKTKISHHIRHDLYKKFTKIILASEDNGFSLIFQLSPKVNSDFILSAAEEKIHHANTLFRQGNWGDAAKILSGLIGLGIGLTPSGDDFLCGILAGLHIQGLSEGEFAQHLHSCIRQNLDRTNEISQAFLLSALDGHFSLAVNELWENPDLETISQSFHAIGHSSGMDTLCGIYFLFFLME